MTGGVSGELASFLVEEDSFLLASRTIFTRGAQQNSLRHSDADNPQERTKKEKDFSLRSSSFSFFRLSWF